ncbi:unnamed protein product [Ilex paraguariensis]
MLRRLLCFNSLPTHPFDHIKEAYDEAIGCDKLQYLKAEERVEAPETPGIVARLMGLESIPRIDVSNNPKCFNSIARSRSMNSMDVMREFKSIQGRHRRVQSFREAPTFVELEDEQFLILSFETGGETKELRSKSRDSEKGFGELKHRRAEKWKNKNKRRQTVYEKNKENQDANKGSAEKVNRVVTPKPSQKVRNGGKVKDSSNILRPTKKFEANLQLAVEVEKQSKPIKNKQNLEGGRSRKKKENNLPIERVERNSDSENTSPVSVLDFGDFPIDPEVPTSDDISRLDGSNIRRTLLEDLKNYQHSNESDSHISISADSETRKIEGKCARSKKKDHQGQNHVEMWAEICKLAEADMKQSHWMYRKPGDFEEIGADFGLDILDQLLAELVYELVGTCQEYF